MMQINLMGFILCSGATLSFLLSIGKVAQACSEMEYQQIYHPRKPLKWK